MNRFELNSLVVMLSLTTCSVVCGQSYVGSLYLPADTGRGERVGTAFVAGANHNIFTAAHVASLADTLWYTPVDSQHHFRIHREFSLPGYDLAVFSRTGGQQPYRIRFGDFNRLRPGDSVRYSGWKGGGSKGPWVGYLVDWLYYQRWSNCRLYRIHGRDSWRLLRRTGSKP